MTFQHCIHQAAPVAKDCTSMQCLWSAHHAPKVRAGAALLQQVQLAQNSTVCAPITCKRRQISCCFHKVKPYKHRGSEISPFGAGFGPEQRVHRVAKHMGGVFSLFASINQWHKQSYKKLNVLLGTRTALQQHSL